MSIQIRNSSNVRTRTRSRLSLTLIFAMTASLMVFPSSAADRTDQQHEARMRSDPVAQSSSGSRLAESPVEASSAYGKTPLYFEANHGQTDAQVQFITRAGGATVFLTPTAAVFVLSAPDESASARATPRSTTNLSLSNNDRQPTPRKMHALRMNIEGANAQSEITGQDKLPGIVNYFKGNDRGRKVAKKSLKVVEGFASNSRHMG